MFLSNINHKTTGEINQIMKKKMVKFLCLKIMQFNVKKKKLQNDVELRKDKRMPLAGKL